jgi:O-antigen ligase
MPLRRRLPLREKVVCALLVLSVSLGSLVNLSGVTTLQRSVVLVVLLVGTILALPGGHLQSTVGRAAAVLAFVACTVVSYLRFAANPIAPISSRTMLGLALMLTLVTAFAFCALLAPADAEVRRRRLRCALFAPVSFAALNLALYIVGFHLPTAQSEIEQKANNGSAQLLGLVGIHTARVTFPLSPGLNGAGEAAALAFVICVVLARRSRGGLRWVSLLGVLVGLASVLLTDSRGPLAYALGALSIVIFLPRRALRAVAIIPLVLPLTPAIILFIVGHLGSVSESLNRNAGKGSFSTATGRSTIWSFVTQFLSHPHAEDLIGYGAYGQVRSGVAYQYAYLFSYKAHPAFTSVHNIALQVILDTGYIGLALLLIFLVVAVNSARISYQRHSTPESGALLVALIALSLFGASEALPGLAGIYLLIAAIVLACAAVRLPPTAGAKPNSKGDTGLPYLTADAPRMSPRPQTLAS